MNEALLNRVSRFIAADMSSQRNKNSFERSLLSRVAVNPHHVTTMNDVLVVPIESNFLLDVKTTSKLICKAVGMASSRYALKPGVFDFACAYPPPKLLGGTAAEKPVPMTIAARVSRKKKNSLVVHFVTRDALHGKEICSGQQLFYLTKNPLFVPADESPVAAEGHDAYRSGGDDEVEDQIEPGESIASSEKGDSTSRKRKAPTRSAAYAQRQAEGDLEEPDDAVEAIDDDDEGF